MVVENNPLRLAYNQIESVINSNVTDINAARLALLGQWIFPTVPTAIDEKYPRISIRLDRAVPEEVGAGRFFETTYVAGSATQDTFGNYVRLFFSISCFIKRDQQHLVTLLGEAEPKNIKNNLQTVYLMNQVQKQLNKNKDTFIQNGVEEAIVGELEAPYEDGEFFWASSIPMEMVVPNIWGTEFDAEDLIASFELTVTPDQELT